MTTSQPDTIRRHRIQAALFYWLWLPGLVIGSGLLLDRFFHLHQRQPEPFAQGTALLLVVLGIGLIWRAERDLARLGGGTPSPVAPSRQLVTRGSFALCRHPMTLGYDLAALGILFYLGSPAMILVSYPLLILWQVRSLRKEEVGLARRFSETFPAYRAQTPFLIPRLPFASR
jgi:protein-S-isoprenylcysteine O-methyltransferase Ste14